MGRLYGMSDWTLINKSRRTAYFVTRDIAQFDEYDVQAAEVAAFLTKVDAFENMPTDDEWRSNILLATAAKNAKVEEVYGAIRGIMVRIEAQFGINSPMYTAITLGELAQIPDTNLNKAVQKLVRKCTANLAAFENTGLTAAKLAELTALGDAAEALVIAKENLVSDRDLARNAREAAGNEIYDTMSDWCKFGQAIWKNTNDAKYDDYIIYDADDLPNSPPPAVEGFGFDAQSGKATWLDSDSESSYEVAIEENGVITTMNIGKDVTELTVALGAVIKRVRIRARNAAGVGPWSDWIEIPAAAQPPMPTNLQYVPESNGNPGVTTADAPAGATTLRMFYQPDGHPKTEIGVMTNGAYPWTLWLLPGTIFVQAEFPGGVVSAQATLRVE